MEGKVWVGAAESGNEVVFEYADGAFGGIASVDLRWCELVIDVFCGEELLEGNRGFVVESM